MSAVGKGEEEAENGKEEGKWRERNNLQLR
jgi:hypothetical protein